MVLRGARFSIGPRGSGASRGTPEPENLLYRPGEEVCKHAVRADNRHSAAGYDSGRQAAYVAARHIDSGAGKNALCVQTIGIAWPSRKSYAVHPSLFSIQRRGYIMSRRRGVLRACFYYEKRARKARRRMR